MVRVSLFTEVHKELMGDFVDLVLEVFFPGRYKEDAHQTHQSQP